MPMVPLRPPPERVPGRRRWSGIRVQLLVLLLPAVALMQALDSWGDHFERMSAIESAYDQALLEPLLVLNNSVHFNANGEVDLAGALALQAMFASVQVRPKHLHVGLAPLSPGAGAALAERTLMGVSDLPVPPADAKLAQSPPAAGNGYAVRIVFYTVAYRGDPVRVVSLQRELQGAAGQRYRLRVQVAESTEQRADARQASLRHEVLQDLRTLAVTALLVWLGIVWALRPLQRLRASLRERSAHDLRPLDASDVPNEVAPLVEAVNTHIANNRQLLAEQGRFLADASHQLRTPLAIMTTQAGYALRERDPKLLHETLRAIIAQLARSRRLSDQLLAMAHASLAIDDAEPLALVDLNAVARDVVLQYLPLAREKNQDLGWVDVRGEDTPTDAGLGLPAAPVRARAAELHEALANLLHNAIRHTPVGGRITVAVRIEGELALAEVSDGGPGIALERREAVFQRFRLDSAANTDAMPGGAGLGLAIARAYARRNGGDIVLADAAQQPGSKGLCARLMLPLAIER